MSIWWSFQKYCCDSYQLLSPSNSEGRSGAFDLGLKILSFMTSFIVFKLDSWVVFSPCLNRNPRIPCNLIYHSQVVFSLIVENKTWEWCSCKVTCTLWSERGQNSKYRWVEREALAKLIIPIDGIRHRADYLQAGSDLQVS